MRGFSPLRQTLLGGLIGLALATNASSAPQSVPAGVSQLMVAIAKTWDSDKALLWRFERDRNGVWQPQPGAPIPVMLGRSGLAWGIGVIPAPQGTTLKREGDRRTPAGLFKIGKIYGYPDRLPRGSNYPYHQIGPLDAWIDDPKNPYYNQHFVATPGREPSWLESQRMRLGDHAYNYRIEVRHNSDPPLPGYGSAIFFHIRRGADRPSAGCTTMQESDLESLIRWLREDQNPHYVILPKAEYDRLQQPWNLPAFQ